MQQIKIKAILLGAVFAAGIAACCFLVIIQRYLWAMPPAVLALLAVVYLYQQLQSLKAAKLIQENVVINIPAGRVISNGDISRSQTGAGIDHVIVSIFGVLAGDRVYKFNCDGIRLLSMKIDKEFIFFTYGTREKQLHLKLTHGLTREEDLQKITEIFRYNTGTGELSQGSKIC